MIRFSGTSHSSVRVFFHALLPTSASIVTAFIVACSISGTHLLVMAINGQVTPAALNDHALESYQNFLVGPLLQFTNNTTVNAVLATFLWGLFGWIVYACIAFVIQLFTNWRTARSEIQIVEGTIIHVSETKTVVLRALWRLGISIATVAFTVAAQPLFHRCFHDDYELINSRTVHAAVIHLLPTLGLWMVTAHCYTVLLRLYMMRTRILGEILY